MVDRPIIFSAPMVRALLDGRKSQTRRVLSPGSIYDDISSEAAEDFELRGWDTFWRGDIRCASLVRYAVDDRLWVRETWRTPANFDDRSPVGLVTSCLAAGYERAWCPIKWEADDASDNWGDWRETPPGRLRAAMYLPRPFSRITLTVTAVRVERLQDISSTDAIAEGIRPHANSVTIDCDTPDPRDDFESLWESLHGPGSWAANPWVVALSFTTAIHNIDTPPANEVPNG